jgi:hypothetical protein
VHHTCRHVEEVMSTGAAYTIKPAQVRHSFIQGPPYTGDWTSKKRAIGWLTR